MRDDVAASLQFVQSPVSANAHLASHTQKHAQAQIRTKQSHRIQGCVGGGGWVGELEGDVSWI